MAFDPENHTIDPATGFHIHKETGHRIGVDPAPIKRLSDETEYPKWVVPHIGHISHHPIHGYVVVPTFTEHHVNRVNGEVMVLVANAEEEERALADPNNPPPPEPAQALLPPPEAA